MTDQLLLSPNKHQHLTQVEPQTNHNNSTGSPSKPPATEPSPVNNVHAQKTQLHNVESQITAMEHRIMLLRQQQQKEKRRIQQQNQKTKDVIEKKLQISEIQKLKQRDVSQDLAKIQQLKRQNMERKAQHQMEMNTILQACYLVKLDQARQLKSLSQAHQRKIQEIKGEIYSEKKAKQTKIKQIDEQSKRKYQQFWRDKLRKLYTAQEQSVQQVVSDRLQKQQYLRQLEMEEQRMLQKLGNVQRKSLDSKREYVTALNIPVKDVVQVVQGGGSQTERMNSSMEDIKTENNNSNTQRSTHGREPVQHWSMKLPKTNLNEAKLRMIMNQLKRTEKRKSSASVMEESMTNRNANISFLPEDPMEQDKQ